MGWKECGHAFLLQTQLSLCPHYHCSLKTIVHLYGRSLVWMRMAGGVGRCETNVGFQEVNWKY